MKTKRKKYFQVAFGSDPCTHHGARRRADKRACGR